MTAHASPSAAPPNALPIWTDGLSLFTQLPGPQSPMVLRYPLTAQGLSTALGLIRTHAYDTADRAAQPSDLPRTGTLAQQMTARSVLKSMKLIA